MAYIPLNRPIGEVLLDMVKEKNPGAGDVQPGDVEFQSPQADPIDLPQGSVNNTKVSVVPTGGAYSGSAPLWYSRLDPQVFYSAAFLMGTGDSTVDISQIYSAGMTNGDILFALETASGYAVDTSSMPIGWLSQVPAVVNGAVTLTMPSGTLIWQDGATLTVNVSGACSLFFIEEDDPEGAGTGLIYSSLAFGTPGIPNHEGSPNVTYEGSQSFLPSARPSGGTMTSVSEVTDFLTALSGVDFAGFFTSELQGNQYSLYQGSTEVLRFHVEQINVFSGKREMSPGLYHRVGYADWAELISAAQTMVADEDVGFTPYRFVVDNVLMAGVTTFPLYDSGGGWLSTGAAGSGPAVSFGMDFPNGDIAWVYPPDIPVNTDTVVLPSTTPIDPATNEVEVTIDVEEVHNSGSPDSHSFMSEMRDFPVGSVFRVTAGVDFEEGYSGAGDLDIVIYNDVLIETGTEDSLLVSFKWSPILDGSDNDYWNDVELFVRRGGPGGTTYYDDTVEPVLEYHVEFYRADATTVDVNVYFGGANITAFSGSITMDDFEAFQLKTTAYVEGAAV